MSIDITFSPQAKDQIELIFKNDPTLTHQTLRLSINGKGCDGFEYALGFTKKRPNDLVLYPLKSSPNLPLSLDSFSAHYLQRVQIDFIQSFENGKEEEGFVVTNLDQSQYSGKFWKKDPHKIPPEELNPNTL